MALNHSPQVVTNGLVFYYDMANSQKSWKGAPTTNLVNPSWAAWSIDGSGQGSIGTRTITSTYECIILDTAANTRQNTYVTGIAGSTTYTFSVQYKKVFGAPTLRFQLQSYNGGTPLGSVFPTTVQLGLTDKEGWQTAFYTYTTSAGADRVLWFMQDGDDYTTYTHSFILANAQCEAGSFATPFVAGTRSNTQAVLDLTGRRTVSVGGSPTYGSDGTFTFSSSGSTTLNLGSGNNFLPMPSLTLEAWIKTPGLGSGMSVNGIWGFTYGIRFNAASDGSLYFIIGTDVTTFVNIGTSGVNVNDNNWHHVVAVKNGDSSCAIYVDGVVRASGTPVAGWSGTNPWAAMEIQVGRDQNDAPYYFNGRINVGRVYNRGLSATEVQQNFNAQRGRYGI